MLLKSIFGAPLLGLAKYISIIMGHRRPGSGSRNKTFATIKHLQYFECNRESTDAKATDEPQRACRLLGVFIDGIQCGAFNLLRTGHIIIGNEVRSYVMQDLSNRV